VATNSFRLPIDITDVDFQFDRRKVTVYYSAVPPHQRVDFRDLVTHLSDVYTTRVWMVLE
jgi:cell fate regulator YaaT (PSP1 superfamily)